MADRNDLINILTTVELASSGQVEELKNFLATPAASSLLESPRSPTSAYSLLLYFLPEAVPFKDYADLIHNLLNRNSSSPASIDSASELLPSTAQFDQLSDQQLEKRVKILSDYVAEKTHSYGWNTKISSTLFIDDWIKARVRLVDDCTGLAADPTPLFDITETAESDLFTWQYGIVQVITQFRNFYYTHTEWLSLQKFESMDPSISIQYLLQFTSVETVVRDVNTLVVPYLTYKCAKDYDYTALWDWVGQTSKFNDEDPPAHLLLLVQLVEAGGIMLPSDDGLFKFIRAVLSYLYMYPAKHYTPKTYVHFAELHNSLSNFELDTETPDYKVPDDIPETDLTSFHNMMQSRLTDPTLYALSLFDSFTSSAQLLSSQINDITLNEVVLLNLYGDEQEQTNLARKYIFGQPEYENKWKLFDTTQWNRIRDNLRWLKNKAHVLAKVSDTWIDETLLVSTLSCDRFDFVNSHYVNVRRSSVPTNVVIKHLLDAFYENFDKATSCNKSLGGLKSAASCLNLLEEKQRQKKQPALKPILRASRLLAATSELANYSLTLTPGVPLHPVELRIQTNDPLSIIHRVLELNPTSYQDLPKLQTIASDLVYGILGHDLPHSDLKVRAMCIDAALVDSNFTQAYAYTDILRNATTSSMDDEQVQQLTWTTCYQVGKFVSPYWDEGSSSVASILEKQLELLSHTLATAPRENLPSILSAWQRIEAQLGEAREQNIATEQKALSQKHVPGENIEMLKSASSRFARAIQSSATATFGSDHSTTTQEGQNNQQHQHNEELHNSRRRDQLSGLLVSGLGWAIGANPR